MNKSELKKAMQDQFDFGSKQAKDVINFVLENVDSKELVLEAAKKIRNHSQN